MGAPRYRRKRTRGVPGAHSRRATPFGSPCRRGQRWYRVAVVGVGVLIAAQVTGLTRTISEAARLIDPRGLGANASVVERKTTTLNPSGLTPEGVIKLSYGKKKHVLLKPV